MRALIVVFLFGLALFCTRAHPQTAPAGTVITSAYVLGCANPAPATGGKPTVFFQKCITAAFVPTSSSSVLASGNKTTPVWAHSFGSYAPTDLLVTCPAGATVSAASCTSNGTDASIMVPQAAVSGTVLSPVVVPPVTPTCPDTIVAVQYTCSIANNLITCTAPVPK